jgi:hypothetical protein
VLTVWLKITGEICLHLDSRVSVLESNSLMPVIIDNPEAISWRPEPKSERGHRLTKVSHQSNHNRVCRLACKGDFSLPIRNRQESLSQISIAKCTDALTNLKSRNGCRRQVDGGARATRECSRPSLEGAGQGCEGGVCPLPRRIEIAAIQRDQRARRFEDCVRLI